MTDRDNITLPREVVELALDALEWSWGGEPMGTKEREAITALRTALAAEKRHPDYVIGNHWFETAYERLCAGEAEDAILEDYELVREPRLRDLRRDAERYRYLRSRDPKEVFNKSGKAAGVWIDWEDDLSGLQLLTGDDADAAIDAAMEASTAPASAAAEASKAPEDKT